LLPPKDFVNVKVRLTMLILIVAPQYEISKVLLEREPPPAHRIVEGKDSTLIPSTEGLQPHLQATRWPIRSGWLKMAGTHHSAMTIDTNTILIF
jgi:hypothetical protein